MTSLYDQIFPPVTRRMYTRLFYDAKLTSLYDQHFPIRHMPYKRLFYDV